MNPQLKERIETFKATAKGENKNRILNCGNVWAWTVWDNGYSPNQIARDYELR